ncbi:L,D-transpeptidase family protein [Chitinophaga sp. CB10]|uniref:L,D-transpeptidase family protein n=1 Tax=Chitinophaga sp. CB10 TaxID=1891659 RepID=UPI0025C27BF0|nr:L,D-transpeptidase family protein [Chitinophaga sp. CB10]
MNLRFYTSMLLLFILAFAACQQNGGQRKRLKARDTVHYSKEEYIERTLDSNQLNTFLAAHPTYQPYAEFIKNFYSQRNYHYAWINKEGLTEQAGNFINMMKNDAAFGIKDSSVNTPELRMLIDTLELSDSSLAANAGEIPRVEMMLTSQFFSYGNKVWGGLTSDNAKDLEWFIPRKKLDMSSLLDSMITGSGNIETNAPVNPQYKMLRERLKQLAVINEHVKWDTLPSPPKNLKKGDSSALVAAVKLRLQAYGDLPGHDSSGIFDQATDTAIRNYQVRMGLKEDGLISPAVIKSLNVPVAQRIRQVLLNMERLRWVAVEPPKTYILVNVPEFKMHVYQNGKLDWSCNVVVGTPGANTVIFSNELKYIVFSPYWNVPPGILSKEVLPGIKRSGSSYLARQNMEIVGASGKPISPGSINWGKYSGGNFPYVVRQRPGGKNSLGKVKFLFPNEYNIYLHDTPAKYLFERDKRSFSHGCIRVEEPKHLAMWLLRDDSTWTEQKIDEAMNAGKEKYVTLKEKVPVFIGYFTAFVDSQGRLNFRDDVYGHDAKLAATLFGKN